MCMILKPDSMVRHGKSARRKNGKIIAYKVLCSDNTGTISFMEWKTGTVKSNRPRKKLLGIETRHELVNKGLHVFTSLKVARMYKDSVMSRYSKIIRVMVKPQDVVATGWTVLNRWNTRCNLRTLVCMKAEVKDINDNLSCKTKEVT